MCKGDMALELTKMYNANLKQECLDTDGQKLAAYGCGGLMLHFFESSFLKPVASAPHPWALSQINIQHDSMSVAFLSKATPFSRLGQAGYILHPLKETPSTFKRFDPICAFPYNAATDSRPENNGCGHFCELDRIHDFRDWSWRTNPLLQQFPSEQCAWNLKKGDRIKTFYSVIQAHGHLQDYPERQLTNNEVLIKPFDPKQPDLIPYKAFYYVIGHFNGEEYARRLQAQLEEHGGRRIPIVRIRPPTLQNPDILIENVSE